eukprot:TRINITY_DN1706_c0_g1_i2.p2 TRINITY_DN1706_c0_g1~~TRINITY_DN1706_c0_g1_i2.p2  ORF type:complete len:139 (-),score=10.39 TRINITY_DN1706_c0_g1_i2:436-852(-)
MNALRGLGKGVLSPSAIRSGLAARSIAPVYGGAVQQARKFGIGHGDYAYHLWWANFWKYFSYCGVASIFAYGYYIFVIWGHPHYEYCPPYPYRRVRRKPFPWGDCNLFDKDCWDALRAHLKAEEEAKKAEAAAATATS